MSDLKTTLTQLSERGTPVGSDALRERVALDLAGGRPPLRVPSGWQVALWAAAFVLIIIGSASLMFGGSEDSAQPAGPSDPQPAATPSSIPSSTTTVPPTTTVPVTTPPPTEVTTIKVPALYSVASEDDLEGIMSELGLEYRVEGRLVMPEGEREHEGIVAIQEPEPNKRVNEGAVITIWLYGDPIVPEYPTPDTGTWTYYNASDGLAANCVTTTASSPDGTVWVGCSAGLSRFVDGAWETIAGFDIIDLAASDDGSLWVVMFMDPGGLSAVRHLVNDVWTSPAVHDAFAIASGPNGTAAAGPSSPLSFFDGDEWTRIDGGEGWWVAISPDGTVWASGNETGLMKYSDDEWSLVSRPPWMSQDEAPGVPAMGTEAIWAAPDGSLWAAGEGLIQFVDGGWTTHLESVRPTDVAFSGDNVWVATAWNGAYRFDGQEWTQYTTVNGLLSAELTSITVSADGHIWFGTAGDGVARMVLERR